MIESRRKKYEKIYNCKKVKNMSSGYDKIGILI